MLLRFLVDKAFSADGTTVVRVRAGEEAVVPSRLAARYLEQGVAVDPSVKAMTAAPENKAAAVDVPVVPDPPKPAAPRGRGGRRRAA